MNNLIITLISIALIGIAVITGVFYGSQAYQNAQINVTANSIMNEAQQILQAERIWSVNNGYQDITGMKNFAHPGMNLLISSGGLSQWPPLAGNNLGVEAGNKTAYNYGGGSGTTSTGGGDYTCYYINGSHGRLVRALYYFQGNSYVLYGFGAYNSSTTCNTSSPIYNDAGAYFAASNTDTSQNQIVKIAVAINKALAPNIANDSRYTMTSSGIPVPGNTSTFVNSYTSDYWASIATGSYLSGYEEIALPGGNVSVLTNACFYMNYNGPGGPFSAISCIFGPS